MLDRVHANSKHKFLDDMESLVHLVLYCALLYLPHALEKDALLQTFHEYFEAMAGVPPGPAHGGDLKFRTAHDRGLIRAARFGSASLAEWLTTMLEMQCPPGWRTEGYNYGERWTPEDVDAFWSEFLNTHTLERDDRVVHDVTKAQRYDYDELSVTAPTAPPTPMAAPALARKRSAAERDLPEGEHDSKRRRSMRLQGVLAPSPDVAPQQATDGPRRSERIKVIHDRAERLSMPSTRASASAPKRSPVAARRTAGGRGRGRGRGRARK